MKYSLLIVGALSALALASPEPTHKDKATSTKHGKHGQHNSCPTTAVPKCRKHYTSENCECYFLNAEAVSVLGTCASVGVTQACIPTLTLPLGAKAT